ncbi:hypothetical protein NLJ89_g11210 [Agrocybe chaxingu]|uniref:Uncharacterized protein n=1 Tax=Agrocybe chaxingu TaxID=84603 RepID=A0A9W8JQE5_9AGAR|nr:hypothetical protein NLJ89_g11210 [Agrocybe chaxingu]
MPLPVTESTPLLLDAEDAHVRNAPVSAIGIDQTPLNLTSYGIFLRSLAWDSIPVILSYILQNSIQTTSIVVTGRLGPHELSVAAFSHMAAFEIVALAAGRLGEIPLAAQSVIMTTDQILSTLPFGIGVAASTRVGNLLGSRSPIAAKVAAHSAALLSVIVGLVVMTSMMLAKDVFGLLFSDDKEVTSLVSRVMPLVASFQVADGLAGSCGGVLRGQGQSNPFSHISFIHSPGEGRQHLGALFNLVAYYVLALPMGFALAFDPKFDLGLQGLWIGQVLALFIVGIGEYCVVWLGTDWELEVKKGIERNREEAKRRA